MRQPHQEIPTPARAVGLVVGDEGADVDGERSRCRVRAQSSQVLTKRGGVSRAMADRQNLWGSEVGQHQRSSAARHRWQTPPSTEQRVATSAVPVLTARRADGHRA